MINRMFACVAWCVSSVLATAASAAVIAYDTAANYSSTEWQTGANKGTGWGWHWAVNDTYGDSFIGQSRLGSKSFVFVSQNSSELPSATRSLASPLKSGDTFSFEFDPISVNPGGLMSLDVSSIAATNLSIQVNSDSPNFFYQARFLAKDTGVPANQPTRFEFLIKDTANNFMLTITSLVDGSSVVIHDNTRLGSIQSLNMATYMATGAFDNFVVNGIAPEPVLLSGLFLLPSLLARRR